MFVHFLKRGWCFCFWLILWSLHDGIILYLKPLKRDYSAGQLGQLRAAVGVYWSCAHLGHLVDFQLQGLGIPSLLQCLPSSGAW